MKNKKTKSKKIVADMKNRYQSAYDNIYNNYPQWKKTAIREDIKNNYQSGLLTEFIKKVIETAEDDQISFGA